MAQSFFLGFILVTLFFFLSLFIVLGVKISIFYVKSYLHIDKKQKSPIVDKKVKKKKPVSPSLIRSIEINPEEIDRIYVKKTG